MKSINKLGFMRKPDTESGLQSQIQSTVATLPVGQRSKGEVLFFRKVNLLVVSVMVFLAPVLLHAQFLNFGIECRNISIDGHYSHIFSNGAAPETNDYFFVIQIKTNCWSISVTNSSLPKEWGVMQYDGTNIYTMTAVSWNGYKAYGYVYPGQFYIPEAEDAPHLFFPWMVFFLTPEMIEKREHDSFLDTPAPWGKRFSLLDYGFRWETSYFENNKIIRQINAVRDPSLDLKSDEDEFRRPSVNYPFEYSSADHRLETLQARKGVPAGFLRATYECQQVGQTNDIAMPSVATFVEYWPNFKNPRGAVRLVFQMVLKVENVKILKNEVNIETKAAAEMTVYDYRYQSMNSRTKFNYATYYLKLGEPFPSAEDPNLKAQAQKWLKSGPVFQGVQSKRKLIIVGMFMMTLIISTMLVVNKIKKLNKHSKT